MLILAHLRTYLRCTALLAAGLISNAHAHTVAVAVAVASNFTAPMQKIAAQFEQDTGHKAELSFGATGKFYAQIRNGAPFEVLLSADSSTAEKIAKESLGDANTRFTYATGKLVLWSAQPNYVDAQGQVLRTAAFQHIAVANPKVAPYGLAAQQTLQHLGVLQATQPKWVQGENIGQTYQFVATGNAQLGFVALSQVMVDGVIGHGSAWVIPSHMHDPIHQDAIVLNQGHNNAAAHALMTYLKSDKARAIIQSYGYDVAQKLPTFDQ